MPVFSIGLQAVYQFTRSPGRVHMHEAYLQVSVDDVQAMQVLECQQYLRGVELCSVLREPAA